MRGNNKTLCFVTNLSFAKEPTVKNRLIPYVTQAIDRGLKVDLVTSDSSMCTHIESPLFKHVLFPSKVNKPSSFIWRAIFEWIEARRLLKSVNKLNVEMVFLTIPSMFLLFNASLLKNKKVCLDVRDLTWEYLSDKSLIQYMAKVFFRFLAARSFKFVSTVIVSNQSEAKFFKEKGINALIYFNGVSSKQFRDLTNLSEKQSKKFTITYVGKVGLAQNLRTFVMAAQEVKDVVFNIVGYGSEFNSLKDMVSSKLLTNVQLYENANWSKVLYFYQESDILYAQLGRDFSSAVPSKLYQYISSGRFIIYGGCGQAVKTLSQFSHNILVPPDDVNELVRAIRLAQHIHKDQLNFEENLKKIQSDYIREENVSMALNGCGQISDNEKTF